MANTKYDSLLRYAQSLMDIGIEVVAEAHVEIGEKWARDPKIVALALLCRTLCHMKGATLLIEQQLLTEAQILARCCTENLICVGALQRAGEAFVDELLRADAASKQKLAKIAIGAYENNEDQLETVVRLREIVRGLANAHPDARRLSTHSLAKNNPVGSSYTMFSVLSEQAVHVSATSLGRHIRRIEESGGLNLQVDVAPEHSDEQSNKLLLDLMGAVLTVIVGANQILGGTRPGLRLAALLAEFESIRDC